MVERAYERDWASSDHFTVDGTLIDSYASMKSVAPRATEAKRVSDLGDDDDPGNPTVSFRGTKRSNTTHQSLTDPEARLARKSQGTGAKLSHAGHVLMENRNGLVVDVSVSEANGYAEREEALAMVQRTRKRHSVNLKTLAADKGYGAGAFLHELETNNGVVPLIPIPDLPIKGNSDGSKARRRAKRRQKTKRYQVAQRVRKRVEEIFGWAKTIGGLRRSRHVGRWKIAQQALIVNSAYNLLRMARLETG